MRLKAILALSLSAVMFTTGMGAVNTMAEEKNKIFELYLSFNHDT